MEEELTNITGTRLANVASRAVGVEKNERCWFVAIVLNNTEHSSCYKLRDMGFEAFIPVRTEIVVWKNGRKKKREKVLIPTMVFVRCSERERLDIVKAPFIKYFLVDRAKPKIDGLRHPIAVIPDEQIRRLQFLLNQDNESVSIEPISIRVGEMVEVIRGTLKGLIGKIYKSGGINKISILIDGLGYACVNIDVKDIEIVTNRHKK